MGQLYLAAFFRQLPVSDVDLTKTFNRMSLDHRIRHTEMNEVQVLAPKQRGLGHLFCAARYSGQGLLRLSKEMAFRHEAFVAGGLALAMLAVGIETKDFALGIVLLLGVFAAEAINTAIEEVADLVSPTYSPAIKHAKDLGSFMVALAILGAYGYCATLITLRLLA